MSNVMIVPFKHQIRIPHPILGYQRVSYVTFAFNKLSGEHVERLHSEVEFALFSKWNSAVSAQ